MKTISLEVNDQIYQQVISFLRLIPDEQCRLIEEEENLSLIEEQHVQIINQKLKQGDESEFDDWDDIKKLL